MPTLRQRLSNFLLGDEKRRLEATTRALWEAYQDGPYQLPPDQLVMQLKEYDSAVLEDLMNQLYYDRLSMLGYTTNSDAERQRQVDESVRLWKYNPLAQWMVWTWTNYGFGDSVSIRCVDKNADKIFQECWTNNAVFEDDHIHELSNQVCVMGELFLACYESALDGSVTFSVIPSSEIKEIVTAKNNSQKPIFYKRQFVVNGATKTLYYPDWEAYNNQDYFDLVELPNGAQRADKENDFATSLGDGRSATEAYIMHIAHNRKTFDLRGWPIIGIGASYLRAHKQFMENRLTVSAQKASVVREFITGGGSRGVASVKAKLASTVDANNYIETNPPPVGGNMVHNQAIEMNDMPMSTGASDAKTDHEMYSWVALLSGGLFPTTAGMDTSRWATALAMDKTQAMQWARYQTFWAAQFLRIVKIVLLANERITGVKFDSYDADVSIDSLNLVDFPDIVNSMSSLVNSALTPMVSGGIMPITAAKGIVAELWRLAMQALGVKDDDLTSNEAFEIGLPVNPVTQPTQPRQVIQPSEIMIMRETIGQVLTEYRDTLENLVYNAFNRIKNGLTEPSVMQTALRTEHKRLIRKLGPEAYIEGLREGGVEADEIDNEDKATIAAWVEEQLSYCNGFAIDVISAAGDRDKEKAALSRVDKWTQSLETLGSLGYAAAKANMMATWKINAHHVTEEHCENDGDKRGCLWLNGQRHRLKWFTSKGYIPRENGSTTLTCSGWECGCGCVDDAGELVL